MNNFSHFMGRDGFVWWIGVIEDRNDPDKIGRVRVRCLGYHTENKDDIPTEDLPWAHVILPPTAPYGALHNLVPGMWVMGFWKDPAFMQEPIVTGIIPGYPIESPDSTKGFNDPNGDLNVGWDSPYGKSHPNRIDEPDTSRLARSEKSIDQTEYKPHDEIAARDGAVTTGVPTANSEAIVKTGSVTTANFDSTKHETNGGTTYTPFEYPNAASSTSWNEPATTDKTKRGETPSGDNVETLEARADYKRRQVEYPYNKVYESESGHIFEIDDTPYAERLYRKHRTGTFEEIDADGHKVTKVVGNNYTIVAGVDFINVKGDVNLTIDSNCKTYIKGDWDIQVDGNKREIIQGNVTETYKSQHATTVDKERNETVKGKTKENYTTKEETTSGDVKETYGGKQSTSVSGNRKLQSGAGIDMDAPTIQLN